MGFEGFSMPFSGEIVNNIVICYHIVYYQCNDANVAWNKNSIFK